jgi:hypothetical protein
VPSTFNDQNNPQYYLAVYNSDLTYHSSMLLDMSGNFFNSRVRFAYDENTNQYYIAGMTSLGVTGSTYPFSFDGDPIENRSFILAFDDNNGSENWRREIYSIPVSPGVPKSNCIFALMVDNNSDVYVAGSFNHHNDPNVKIYDPTDSSVPPYFFTVGITSTIPMIIQFDNSDGNVQWVKSITGFNPTAGTPGPLYAYDIAVNNNEIGLGTQGSNLFWGNIEVPRPASHQPDPLLVRFDKQSGNVIDVHDVQGSISENQRMTAVAADNDGNYITGGSFDANLFMNNTLGITPLFSTGEADFFVAKLANSACGSGNMGTEEFNKLSFNVYPNPTTGIVNVQTTDTLLGYTIYDMSGKQIKQSLFAGNNQINLENASNGVYFIIITTVEGNSGTVKVVKR